MYPKDKNILTINYNYHTHAYQSGYSEEYNVQKILAISTSNNIKSIGFCENIPNLNLLPPDEEHRMLLSEVDGYINSINKLKHNNPNIPIFVGFEAEYDETKEYFLSQLKNRVDYMVLGQHFVMKKLEIIDPSNNPNYPIEYAYTIINGIDSGIFDIIAHPDFFMSYRDTMSTEESKKLFEENSIIASQIICEKARDMGIPVEINLGKINEEALLSDGNYPYPHPIFWKIANKTDGLEIVISLDTYNLNSYKVPNQQINSIKSIIDLVKDKIILDEYNPVLKREQNYKLNQSYNNRAHKILTYEAYITNLILKNITIPIETDDIISYLYNVIYKIIESKINSILKKSESIMKEIKILSNDQSNKIKRKKLALLETKNSLIAKKQLLGYIKYAINYTKSIGAVTKEEIVNIVTQVIQYNTTTDQIQKEKIEEHILIFQSSKNIQADLTKIKIPKQYFNPNNSGFVNIANALVIILGIGIVSIFIAYILYKTNLGG